MEEFIYQFLAFLGYVGEFLPAGVPAALVCAQVGHHGGEGRSEGAHRGRYRPAARRCTFRRRLAREGFQRHLGKAVRLFGHEVFNYFLLGVEGLEVVEGHALHGNLQNLFLADPQRTLLFFQVEAAGLQEHTLGNQTHNLCSGDTKATGGGAAGNFFKSNMKGRGVNVRDVHGYLRNAIFVYIPANGLVSLEGAGNPAFPGRVLAAFLAYVKGDGHGPAGTGSVEVEVHGHEEIAGTHVGGTGFLGREVPAAAEVRTAVFIGHLFRKGFVFAFAAHGQVLALRLQGGGLVAVAGNSQLFEHALCEAPGQHRTFFQGDAGYGNEGQYVGGAATGMCPVMLPHVNELLRLGGTAESSFQDRLRLSHKGDHRSVGGFARVYVQYLYAFYAGNSCHNGVNDTLIPSFTVVGNALYQLFHSF